jgi:hypothetical protein
LRYVFTIYIYLHSHYSLSPTKGRVRMQNYIALDDCWCFHAYFKP